MKIVFTRKTLPHPQCVEVDWSPDDNEVSWVSIFYEPTIEETPNGWRQNPADLQAIIEALLKTCVAAGSYTYGELMTIFRKEYYDMVKDIRNAGIKIVTMEDLRKRKGLLGRLLMKGDPRYVYVAGASWQQIGAWYKSYAGWVDTPYQFLVSDRPIENWEGEIRALARRSLQKATLQRVGSYITNHYDHGIEVISLDSKVDILEAEARDVARKLNVSIQVKDKS